MSGGSASEISESGFASFGFNCCSLLLLFCSLLFLSTCSSLLLFLSTSCGHILISTSCGHVLISTSCSHVLISTSRGLLLIFCRRCRAFAFFDFAQPVFNVV